MHFFRVQGNLRYIDRVQLKHDLLKTQIKVPDVHPEKAVELAPLMTMPNLDPSKVSHLLFDVSSIIILLSYH